jgi:hypothetical protein
MFTTVRCWRHSRRLSPLRAELHKKPMSCCQRSPELPGGMVFVTHGAASPASTCGRPAVRKPSTQDSHKTKILRTSLSSVATDGRNIQKLQDERLGRNGQPTTAGPVVLANEHPPAVLRCLFCLGTGVSMPSGRTVLLTCGLNKPLVSPRPSRDLYGPAVSVNGSEGLAKEDFGEFCAGDGSVIWPVRVGNTVTVGRRVRTWYQPWAIPAGICSMCLAR